MKLCSMILAAILCIVTAVTSQAQTQPDLNFHFGTNYNGVLTANPYPCGPFTGTRVGLVLVPDYNCDGVPAWEQDQNDVVTNTNLWLDVNYHGQYDFIGFLNETNNLGIAQVTNVTTSGSAVIVTFAGPMAGYVPNPSLPSPPYTGTVTFMYTQYTACTTGRYAHCGPYWKITGLSVNVHYTVAPQPADVTICPTC
jgi:hypothetical protein